MRLLTRRTFIQAGAVLGAVAGMLPWRPAVAGKDKPVDPNAAPLRPKTDEDWKFDCGKYWVADLGEATDYSETPCLTIAHYKNNKGELMQDDKIYVRWERIDPKTKDWIILSAICTHLKCKIEYDPEGDKFKCPCHKSEFSLEGEVLRKPARKKLPSYSDMLINQEGHLYLRRKAEQS